ncbi:MAG: CZB domain-containing protein [Gammaproteobacteria bacterium]|nr:CZB domain-containing protein [Gammaproteobacteria bacterium]
MYIQSTSLTNNILLIGTVIGAPYLLIWHHLYSSGIISTNLLVGVIILLLFDLLLLILFFIGILKPIRQMMQSLQQISQGNLDFQLDNPYYGEIRQLVSNTEKAREASRNSRITAFSQLIDVAKYSIDNADNTGMLFITIKDQQQQVDAIEKQLQQHLDAHQVVLRQAEQVNQKIAANDITSAQERDAISATQESVNHLHKTLSHAAAETVKLRQNSISISEITKLINEIADQIRLLSLNTAIEADEMNKEGDTSGFKAIAEEINNIAQQTEDATRVISSVTQKVHEQIERTEEAMNEGLNQVKISLHYTRQMEDLTTTNDHQNMVIKLLLREISYSIDQQRQETDAMRQKATAIRQISHRSSAEMDATIQSIDKLYAVLSKQLRLFSTYNLPGKEIAIGRIEHLFRKLRLNKMLLSCGDIVTEESIGDVHQCALGRWYDQAKLGPFAELSSFKALKEPHNHLHQLAHHIFHLKQSEDSVTAVSELHNYKKELTKMNAILDRLYEIAVRDEMHLSDAVTALPSSPVDDEKTRHPEA